MSRPLPNFPAPLAAALAGLLVAGCLPDVRSGAPPQRLEVGERVLAPFSKHPGLFPGEVRALYGRFAHVLWDDGDEAWVPVEELEPRGLPLPDPADEPAYAPGETVFARWTKSPGRIYEARVLDVYGALVHVGYPDGDHLWYRHDGVTRAPVARAPPIPAPPGLPPPPRSGAKVRISDRPGAPKRVARVAEVHGRLAYVYPELGPPEWVEVERLEPRFGPGDVPSALALFAQGDEVVFPGKLGVGSRGGTVEEAYGKLLLVREGSGALTWVRAWEARAP